MYVAGKNNQAKQGILYEEDSVDDSFNYSFFFIILRSEGAQKVFYCERCEYFFVMFECFVGTLRVVHVLST